MKKTILTIAVLATFNVNASEPSAVNSNNYQSQESTQIIDSSNRSNWTNTPKDSYNSTGNTTTSNWENRNENSYNNINNSKQIQQIDNSYTSGSNNKTDVRDSGNSSATGGDSNSKSYATSGSSSASMTSGDTTVKTGSVNVNSPVAINNNQVRQHRIVPFAFSPGMAMSFSQDNCSNSASLGVSTGIFGVSGGVPIGSDDCNRRKDVQMWLATQQPRIACERMIQSEENAAAMKAAGLDCSRLTAAVVAPVVVPSNLNVPSPATYDQWTRQNGIILDKVAAKNLSK